MMEQFGAAALVLVGCIRSRLELASAVRAFPAPAGLDAFDLEMRPEGDQ